MKEYYPSRVRMVSAVMVRFALAGLAMYLLAGRMSRPGFMEHYPDLPAYFLVGFTAAVLFSAIIIGARLLRHTPTFSFSNLGVFIDTPAIGPLTVRWDDIESVNFEKRFFTYGVSLILADRGVRRLGFWRRLTVALACGNCENRVHVTQLVLRDDASKLSREIGRMIESRGRLSAS